MIVISSKCITTSVALVQAYVANNHLPASDVPGLVRLVHGALLDLADGSWLESDLPDTARPDAEAIRQSIKPDGIVSFINGQTYRRLKRHLTANGFDPNSYRKRYGLPDDYPMVASGHSEMRSRLAKGVGPGVSRGRVIEDAGLLSAEPRVEPGQHHLPA